MHFMPVMNVKVNALWLASRWGLRGSLIVVVVVQPVVMALVAFVIIVAMMGMMGMTMVIVALA
jgi:hypothetical protein